MFFFEKTISEWHLVTLSSGHNHYLPDWGINSDRPSVRACFHERTLNEPPELWVHEAVSEPKKLQAPRANHPDWDPHFRLSCG
jgi:hypothetical protein